MSKNELLRAHSIQHIFNAFFLKRLRLTLRKKQDLSGLLRWVQHVDLLEKVCLSRSVDPAQSGLPWRSCADVACPVCLPPGVGSACAGLFVRPRARGGEQWPLVPCCHLLPRARRAPIGTSGTIGTIATIATSRHARRAASPRGGCRARSRAANPGRRCRA